MIENWRLSEEQKSNSSPTAMSHPEKTKYITLKHSGVKSL